MDRRKSLLLAIKAGRLPKFGPRMSREQIDARAHLARRQQAAAQIQAAQGYGAIIASRDVSSAQVRVRRADQQRAVAIARDTRRAADPKFRERAAVEKAEARVAKLEADLAAARQALQAARAAVESPKKRSVMGETDAFAARRPSRGA